MKAKLFTIIILIGFIGIGCEGPEGPQGERGEQGVQGAQGPSGDDGATVFTSVYRVNSSSTQMEEFLGINLFQAPEITHEVYSNGLVQGHYDLTGIWTALPLKLGNVQTTYGYDVGVFAIITITDASTLLRSQVFEGDYKMTVVPPIGSGKAVNEGGMKFPEGTPSHVVEAVESFIEMN